MTSICLLHPGAMGSEIGAGLVRAGHAVRWVTAGRSDASRRRADAAGLVPHPDLASALDGADIVLSICPPHAAEAVATEVRRAGFTGSYLDANAISPATARGLAEILGPEIDLVDGGVVGPPPRRPGTTRLFLSGPSADGLAELFARTPVEPVVVAGPVGKASATKVAFASWSKGSNALLLAVAAYAEAEGVAEPLRAEWARRRLGLAERLEHVAEASAPKAWRFAGELADAGRAFEDVGLPPGFGAAAADVYGRLDSLRDARGVTIDRALHLLHPGASAGSGGAWAPPPPTLADRARRVARRAVRAGRQLSARRRRRR